MKIKYIEKLLESRRELIPSDALKVIKRDEAAEGGCGVIGIACSERIPGRHLLQSLIQMRNRGNGKGGGIAAVGLKAEEFGVDPLVLEQDYLIAVAYLDPEMQGNVEQDALQSTFIIDHIKVLEHIHINDISGLDVTPPEVVVYFVRIKPEVLQEFREKNGLDDVEKRLIEDEIVYQNTFKLNQKYYASIGDSQAFVLSHGKNMIVLKMVGNGDDVIRYYQLEGLHAHVWIGHHRYPTKGRVWHPGGAHPFVGLNEALVHNGDFANYHSISEYLSQQKIYPLFLTDTEVSVQVFDLLHRTYGYPLEYVIESLAPTTERDFAKLTPDKQHIYKLLNQTHIHSSPDGPWFFLIAQSAPGGVGSEAYRLIGITDTSMLRPQVFALQDHGVGGPSIGFAASEKQGIDAALESLSSEDARFWSRADRYWNARGGSYSDGGAFIFSVSPNGDEMVCTDKFGQRVNVDTRCKPVDAELMNILPGRSLNPVLAGLTADGCFQFLLDQIPNWGYADLQGYLESVLVNLEDDEHRDRAIKIFSWMLDRRYPTGEMRRSCVLSMVDLALEAVFENIRMYPSDGFDHLGADGSFPSRRPANTRIVVDARGYEPEGPHSLARALVELYQSGFRSFIVTNTKGHRFIGSGFGPSSDQVRIDVYGSPGDYLASGLDGMEIHVHGSVQDQAAQIMKSGTLIVHGDVGQTFGYAAKGGQIYILGNAAGRAMINAVGKPKIIINGTSLDYLAESFMAGDPHRGGGFVVINGIVLHNDGEILELDEPYPGSNLFSLASGGAIFIRDPEKKVTDDQLNGGILTAMEEKDWSLIRPYLEENEKYFGICIEDLLVGRDPLEVYRKIQPKAVRALQAEEIWVSRKVK